MWELLDALGDTSSLREGGWVAGKETPSVLGPDTGPHAALT